ncbi:MAG: diiron oxygenase [Paracoccaceae bacterium]
MNWLAPEKINALAGDPARQMPADMQVTVDPRAPWVPEQFTQLYYTPLYQGLHYEHRLRYNQLFALRVNEYIMMLEGDLIDRLLIPLMRHPEIRGNAALVEAMQTMLDEEKRHHANFAALNRSARPDLYPPGQDRLFSELPAWTRAMFAVSGLLVSKLAFSMWYVMALEESAMALARAMQGHPETETLGRIDAGFAEVHIQHMKDEARHIHIDGILIDLAIGRQSPRRRRLNAWVFEKMLHGVVTPTRGGSGARVIRQLVREMPELQDREDEMLRVLIGLRTNRAFQESLFSRKLMPFSFDMFDGTEELAGLGKTMWGYDRRGR